MTRRLLPPALLLLCCGAAGLLFARQADALAVCAVVLGALAAAAALRGARTRGVLLAALVGLAVAALVPLALEATLRGERPDTGPDPTVPRTDPRVEEAREAWLLPGEGLRFRATGPEPLVRATERFEITNRAAAPAPGSGPLRILVWGDCRSGVTVFEMLCDAIRERRPDFTVGLGDLVGMARTYQFAIVDGKLAATGVPAFVVPGNHDLDPFGTLRPYCRVFGPRNWSFVFRGTLFIGLDTARGFVDPADVRWMESVVGGRGREAAGVVLFCHHPLFEPHGHPEKPLPEDEATRALRDLVLREKIRVFASHYHGYDVTQAGGTVQVTTGGAGARPETDEPYHYVWVEIGPDGVAAERVDLAEQSAVSPLKDRLLVFRDEGAYAAGAYPLRVFVALLGLAVALGALALLVRRILVPRASGADLSRRSAAGA